jgi:hypothetical protein
VFLLQKDFEYKAFVINCVRFRASSNFRGTSQLLCPTRSERLLKKAKALYPGLQSPIPRQEDYPCDGQRELPQAAEY